MTDVPDRYKDRPILVLLENYVLDAIGALPREKSALMAEVIAKNWGVEGGSAADWRATMRANLELPDDLDASLRDLWERNKAAIPDTFDFARMAVDKLFKDITG